MTTGYREEVQKFKTWLEKRFEIKTRVGNRESESEVAEARVLNRVIRRTEQGWEYEPDQRHAEIIIGALGLEDARGVSTPGEEEKAWEEEDDSN